MTCFIDNPRIDTENAKDTQYLAMLKEYVPKIKKSKHCKKCLSENNKLMLYTECPLVKDKI